MSEAVRPNWRATSPWAAFATSGRGGSRQGEAGVAIGLAAPVGLTTIIGRVGRHDALAASIKQRLGCDLPAVGRAAFGPRCDIVWSAPGQWLVVAHASDVAADLATACADLAAITDQGSSRALVEVSGPSARDALAKGFAIDLHPSVFTAGHAATTALAHMSVQIWQTDDTPCFVIAVPRSFAGSVWSWLDAAAAAYGYEVVTREGSSAQ